MRAIDFSRLVETGLETRAYQIIKKKPTFHHSSKGATKLEGGRKERNSVSRGRIYNALLYHFFSIFHLCHFYNDIISIYKIHIAQLVDLKPTSFLNKIMKKISIPAINAKSACGICKC